MVKQMDLFDFGRAIVEARDLNPHYEVFRALFEENSRRAQRLVLSFGFYNHLASACKVAGFPDFISGMRELRDYSGLPCKINAHSGMEVDKVIKFMSQRSEMSLFAFFSEKPLDFNIVSERIRRIPAFGTATSWKIADIMSCCMNVPVNFDYACRDIPIQALKGISLHYHGVSNKIIDNADRVNIIQTMRIVLGEVGSPNSPARCLNVQEFVAILSEFRKYKTKKGYEIGQNRLMYMLQLKMINSKISEFCLDVLEKGAKN